MSFSFLDPPLLPDDAGSEFDSPESLQQPKPACGAGKAREVKRRIAAGFYDRRAVARETARQILADERKNDFHPCGD